MGNQIMVLGRIPSSFSLSNNISVALSTMSKKNVHCVNRVNCLWPHFGHSPPTKGSKDSRAWANVSSCPRVKPVNPHVCHQVRVSGVSWSASFPFFFFFLDSTSCGSCCNLAHSVASPTFGSSALQDLSPGR